MSNTLNKKGLRITDILYAAAVAGLSSICYKLFYRMATNYHGKYPSDFPWYINLPVSEYKERYRRLGWLFDIIWRHSHEITGMVVYLAAVIGCIVLMNFVFLRFYTGQSGTNRAALQLASLLVPFIGPVYMPGIHEFYYRWSFQIFAWHSPTEQSMILCSLIAFLCFVKMYEESDNGVSLKNWIFAMLSGLLSAFAKPAFIIDLIVAMICLFLIDLFTVKGKSFIKRFRELFIMGCSLIPSGIYMLVIMKYSFNGEGDLHEGEVKVDLTHVLEYKNLLAAIVCGLAFAIVVWAVNIKLLREKRYRTVFAVFLAGILQWALFVEDGDRATHGNFTWGRQIGCYLLVITAVAIAFNNLKDENFMAGNKKARTAYFAILAVLLLLHIGSQLHYFYLICTGHGYML